MHDRYNGYNFSRFFLFIQCFTNLLTTVREIKMKKISQSKQKSLNLFLKKSKFWCPYLLILTFKYLVNGEIQNFFNLL